MAEEQTKFSPEQIEDRPFLLSQTGNPYELKMAEKVKNFQKSFAPPAIPRFRSTDVRRLVQTTVRNRMIPQEKINLITNFLCHSDSIAATFYHMMNPASFAQAAILIQRLASGKFEFES